MTRRPLVLAVLLLLACSNDGPRAPTPEPYGNGPRLVVTIQSGPRAILSGTSVDLVVTVARDGIDAYDSDVDIALAPADGFAAAPVLLPRLATSTKLSLAVAPERRHGVVPLRIVATSTDRTASGEVALPMLVRGVAGALDTSFGAGGVFLLGEASAEATGIVVQSDGKIVIGGRIAGDGAVVRLTADGRPDATFGSAGKARAKGAGFVSTHDVAMAAGGAIVLGGTGPMRTVLARFTASGALDPTFGSQGVLAIVRQARSRALAVADGNVYVAGQSSAPSDQDAMQALRLLPAGALDASWAKSGEAVLPFSGSGCALGAGECFASAVSPRGGGRLTLCASRGDGVNLRDLLATGEEDRNYDLTTTADVFSRCTAIVNDTEFDFWAAGARDANVFAIVHFNISPTGGPLKVEPLFAPLTLPAEAALGGATRLAVGGPGLLVATADATPGGGPSQFALVRVSASRDVLDAAFAGGKGYVTTPIGTTAAFTRALAVQSDGRVLVAGTNGDMAVARYWP